MPNSLCTPVKTFLSALILAISFLGFLPSAYSAGTDQEIDSFVVIMGQDPVIKYQGEIAGYKATKPAKNRKINPKSAHVKKYQRFLEQGHSKALQAVGASDSDKVHDYSIALNGFSARLTDAQARNMAKQPGVVRVMRDVLRQKTTDSSPTFLGVTDSGGAWMRGLTGEGVVVGVIDTGIWPEHPSFADDGSYDEPPIELDDSSRSTCDFGNAAHNENDAEFECNNKLIGARQVLDTYRSVIGAEDYEYDSARDDDGHGTHTASTAAGNSGVSASLLGIERGMVSGIAHRAHIVAYKGLGARGGFSSDLAAAIDQAVADGVDVINYSIGGGPSLVGPDDLAFLFAADAGVYVATSAGNSGPGAGTVGGPGTVPWLTTVGANTQLRMFQGTITLGDGSVYSGASTTGGTDTAPLVDAADAGGDLCFPGGSLDSAEVAGKIVLCRVGSIARTSKSRAVLEAGGVGMIIYNNSDDDNLSADPHHLASVHIDNTPALAIKSYIASAAGPTASIRCCEDGIWPSAPSMARFSSRGPNSVAGDIIKPDITAPGYMVLAGNTPTPAPGQLAGELFQAINGTSMSSPHIAGVFALVKQAHPDWSPAMAKSAVMTTANQDVRDNDRVSQAGPFAMGAGQVDVAGKVNKGSFEQPGLVYDAGFNDYLGFLCDVEPDIFTDPGATCSTLSSEGVPTDASDLNLASIGIAELPGSQTVTRTVTSVARERGKRTYTVSVEAPEGYDVTVSPSSIRLKSGETASYQVTITNDGSATVGEWRTGSLTWADKNGHYSVYSPIAVRGIFFDVPEIIWGSGASGSASIPVGFGYTGPYTAAAHGLAQDTVVNGNVLQDPNQSFDRSDGFSTAHVINMSNAVHARFALPPGSTEAGADLDLYVFDPNGFFVASSTNEGTDEQIDIRNPADGGWTVYVHGWLAPDGDSDYNMDTWVVPEANPTLVLDSAPEAATFGIDTVEVSWSGLVPGPIYLGAVSHTDPNGELGFTLIEIDPN